MITRASCIVLLSLTITQCGFVPRIKGNKDVPTTPNGEVKYDVSALKDNNLFPKGNPVGSLLHYRADHLIGYCSAFAISAFRVLTNHHCINHEGRISSARDIVVIFRNIDDEEQTAVEMTRIVDFDRNSERGSDPVNAGKDYTDWALLETDVDLTRFSPLEVNNTYVGKDFFVNQPAMTLARVNPPSKFAKPPYVTTLDPREAKVDMLSLITNSYLTEQKKELVETCKSEHAGDSAAQANCNNQTYTRDDALEKLEANNTFVIQSQIRLGNSGSPIIYQGKAIGILHSAYFPPGAALLPDQNQGESQFFHHVGNRFVK